MTWSLITSLKQDISLARSRLEKKQLLLSRSIQYNCVRVTAILSQRSQHRVFTEQSLILPIPENEDLCPTFELPSAQTRASDCAFWGPLQVFLHRLGFPLGYYAFRGTLFTLCSSISATKALYASIVQTRQVLITSIRVYNTKRRKSYSFSAVAFQRLWDGQFSPQLRFLSSVRPLLFVRMLVLGYKQLFCVLLCRAII